LDGAGRPKKNENGSTVEQLAKELGKSQTTVKTMRTLADLIPPLATMLDAGEITQAVAYQLAQLDEAGQKSMESWMGLGRDTKSIFVLIKVSITFNTYA
jgi:ParB-like chromosome segregation protein Spo0J